MDYNLSKTVESRDDDIDVAMSFGEMPNGMLVSKFEETDMGPDEDMYDNYARGEICDWTGDKNKFEHEEARGGVNRRAGRLQLQYYGHRGNEDTPYHPERFDGFMGDRDPLGINTEPDFKKLTEQHNARMRFVRWSPDASDQITGGGRSEGKLMADQQTLFKVTQNRLKVFSPQIDGRREGLRREFKHKSNIPKQILVQSYGDYIKDYALNPQRRANIICKEILRNSRTWRDETAEADFAFAKYSQLCRRARIKQKHNPVLSAQGGDAARRNEINDQDMTKCYKAAGLLMANIVKGKRQAVDNAREGNMDLADAKTTVARKTEPFARDLALVLRAMTQDADFATGDSTMIVKNPYPTLSEHIARQVVYNHLAPAHHYLNAEILYKTVRPGVDTRKVKDLIITDANAPQLRDVNTTLCKTAKMKLVSGAKLATDDDTDKAESSRTFNYRHALNPNGDRRIRLVANDMLAGESDATQNRRPNHKNYRITSAEDTEDNMRYGDNACKERHTRGLGSKYMNRFIDRDARDDEISARN